MKPFRKWFGGKSEGEEAASALDSDNIPNHVAVIMDGNGRWAQKRGLPRVAGHHSGMKNVKKNNDGGESYRGESADDVCFFHRKLEEAEGRS